MASNAQRPSPRPPPLPPPPSSPPSSPRLQSKALAESTGSVRRLGSAVLWSTILSLLCKLLKGGSCLSSNASSTQAGPLNAETAGPRYTCQHSVCRLQRRPWQRPPAQVYQSSMWTQQAATSHSPQPAVQPKSKGGLCGRPLHQSEQSRTEPSVGSGADHCPRPAVQPEAQCGSTASRCTKAGSARQSPVWGLMAGPVPTASGAALGSVWAQQPATTLRPAWQPRAPPAPPPPPPPAAAPPPPPPPPPPAGTLASLPRPSLMTSSMSLPSISLISLSTRSLSASMPTAGQAGSSARWAGVCRQCHWLDPTLIAA